MLHLLQATGATAKLIFHDILSAICQYRSTSDVLKIIHTLASFRVFSAVFLNKSLSTVVSMDNE